jgi:hypothetical protein
VAQKSPLWSFCSCVWIQISQSSSPFIMENPNVVPMIITRQIPGNFFIKSWQQFNILPQKRNTASFSKGVTQKSSTKSRSKHHHSCKMHRFLYQVATLDDHFHILRQLLDWHSRCSVHSVLSIYPSAMTKLDESIENSIALR